MYITQSMCVFHAFGFIQIFFFFFKQKTAYEIMPSLVGSEMCIRDSGRSVVKGYGCVHFPTEQGSHERIVHLYKPKPISLFSGLFGFLTAQVPEYVSSERVIAKGEGRDVTRVQSVGKIKVKFEVLKRNFNKFGYN
eukprot:TRINITY_DN948_c0_g1_i1.p1 TRINITY_DN948_c0_g1~~TRINITY_DN948_c0_g1_i1.p1  ORF type:complete len:136 (-),score=22.55 TRINITY_DN948_c0_g1_i1:226-633(-)